MSLTIHPEDLGNVTADVRLKSASLANNEGLIVATSQGLVVRLGSGANEAVSGTDLGNLQGQVDDLTSSTASALGGKADLVNGKVPVGEGGLPSGGTSGQVLTKTNNNDLATQWATPSVGDGTGLPNGGTTGQILRKNSGSNGDASWVDAILAELQDESRPTSAAHFNMARVPDDTDLEINVPAQDSTLVVPQELDPNSVVVGIAPDGQIIAGDQTKTLKLGDEVSGDEFNPDTSHNLTYIRSTGGDPLTVFLDDLSLPVGAIMQIEQAGAGTVTFDGNGVMTLNSLGGLLATVGRYAVAQLVKTSASEWTISGGITPAGEGGGISAPVWHNATLEGSWETFIPGGYNALQYTKDALGFVHLRGIISNGGAAGDGNIVCHLPAGFIPAALPELCSAIGNESICRLTISTDGAVVYASGPTAGWLSLSNISFYAGA